MSRRDRARGQLIYWQNVLKDKFDASELQNEDGFHYLAAPYSGHAFSLEDAFMRICEIAADLIRAGVRLYCPVAHSHSIAIHGGLDPSDNDLWIPFDAPMMDTATGLIVAMIEGWDESEGVAAEIAFFRKTDRPIYYLAPETLECGHEP
jgi:hypothetical protein